MTSEQLDIITRVLTDWYVDEANGDNFADTAFSREEFEGAMQELERVPIDLTPQDVALARLRSRFKSNEVRVVYEPGDLGAGSWAFSLTREGKFQINGGIAPDGSVST